MIIYKIQNKINNKIYIGQTTSSLQERIKMYIDEYKYSKRNRVIINAMRKYGFENFEFSILEDDITSKKILDEKERYYIKFYKSLSSQNGYNVALGGNSKGKHSQETKIKMSESQIGEKNHMYKKRGKENPTSKKTIELTTGLIFDNLTLACEYFNTSISHSASVARGERGSTNGKVFRYMNDDEIILPENIAYIKSKKTRNSVLEKFKHLI